MLAQPTATSTLSSSFMLAWPIAMSSLPAIIEASAAKEPKAPESKLEWLDNIDPIIPPGGKKMDPASQGLAGLSHALDALESSKTHRRHKPPILIDKLEVVDFPANILEQAGPAQMSFMKAILISAPLIQFTVVTMPTDPCTPAQYDGSMVTAAASKGKQHVVLLIDDDSDYGELHSEEEEEAEEGKMPAQCFQHMQQNKKLAKKKVNKVKNTAALAHHDHF
ncbi:hypothetical protein C0992_011873 [Termitomyces sp. T32_za158]|nr:hypothetical protein C0992_011873 [Termitomyces sp. T32_za158]